MKHIPPAMTLTNDLVISDEEILKIIRSLNSYKAHGWDEIYVRVIKMSDAALVAPLKIIFINCLRCGIFNKYGNVPMSYPFAKRMRKM